MKQLPKEWCIKVTQENLEALNKYRNAGGHLSGTDGWVGDYNDGWKGTWSKDKPDYTEITFDDFKRLVLKQEPMNKKLIGYKLKNDCKQFTEAVLLIINEGFEHKCLTLSLHSGGVHISYNAPGLPNLIKTKVLDLWFEEVYEDIKKDVQVQVKASKTLVFTISKNYEGYVIENAENNKVSIQSLADMVNHGFELSNYNSYKVIPVTFNMGCIKDIHSSDIIKVVQAYDEFWGTSYYDLPF